MSVDERVAVVTGGATGIGLGAAEALAKRGVSVAILQPTLTQASEAAERLAAAPAALGVEADVSDPAAVERAFAQVQERFGRLDILVHSAAVTGPSSYQKILTCEPAHVDRVVDVNLKGSIYCARAAAKRMKAGGAIVLVSSVGALAAQEGAAVYCATKAAVSALARGMALEWADLGIRVNAVAPGDILTQTSENVLAEARDSGVTGRYVRSTPLGRRGSPAEIGETIAFLASGEASFITGTTLVADGGFLIY